MSGYLYMIASPDTNLIKIGRAQNLEARFSSIKTGSPVPLYLIFSASDCGELEKNLHSHFSEYRRRLEWFEYTGQLAKFLSQVVDGHGLPPWDQEHDPEIWPLLNICHGEHMKLDRWAFEDECYEFGVDIAFKEIAKSQAEIFGVKEFRLSDFEEAA